MGSTSFPGPFPWLGGKGPGNQVDMGSRKDSKGLKNSLIYCSGACILCEKFNLNLYSPQLQAELRKQNLSLQAIFPCCQLF